MSPRALRWGLLGLLAALVALQLQGCGARTAPPAVVAPVSPCHGPPPKPGHDVNSWDHWNRCAAVGFEAGQPVTMDELLDP